MQLALEHISKKVGAEQWLFEMSPAPRSGEVTVLLGATQAGKTSLMRIMAGLDVPSQGRVLVNDVNVTGTAVRERNVAMVYQQFINYPSLRVADNIASPLKLRGEKNIAEKVRGLAARLHIDMFLDRYPAELSGGQQQRVALARALAKGAPLMLLDEPLVNLDYKLREELREELTQLFAVGDSTVIYATTEPGEALLLGGHTAVLDGGELLQYGPTAEVFHSPQSLRVARAFSDPPMNLMAALPLAQGVQLVGGPALTMALPAATVPRLASMTAGVRGSSLRIAAREGDAVLPGTVELAEISGSDTFVHVATAVGEMVAQLTGVHRFDLGTPLTLYLDPAQVFQFPVIYDTMTVAQNLAFPLRNRKVPEDQIKRRVGEIAEMLDMSGQLDHRAAGLAADAKQKISLGRGLVRPDVSAVLFDEPLTVIDPHLKWELRSTLKDIHKKLNVTMIYVTHDQTEALTFADKVVVMHDGGVVQVGTPKDLFEQPEHTFVGHFIGSPGMNVLPCQINGALAQIGTRTVRLNGAPLVPAGAKKVELGVRPEFVTLTARDTGLPVRIEKINDLGRIRLAKVSFEGHPMVATVAGDVPEAGGAFIQIDPACVHIYADGHRVSLAGRT